MGGGDDLHFAPESDLGDVVVKLMDDLDLALIVQGADVDNVIIHLVEE